MSHNYILSIYKDSRGYIWIFTREGLSRYDGYTFKNYYEDKSDSTKFWGDDGGTIAEDNNGNLWVLTDKCLNKLDYSSDKIYHYHLVYNGDTLRKDHFIIKDSLLWLGSGEGIYSWNIYTQKIKAFKHDPQNPNSPLSGGIMDCILSKDNKIWFTSWGNGISSFDIGSEKFTHFTAAQHGMFTDPVFSLTEDNEGNIWACTLLSGKIAKLDIKSQKVRIYTNKDFNRRDPTFLKALNLRSDDLGNIWIATFTNGLLKFNPKSETYSLYQKEIGNSSSLSENIVKYIYPDREGILWVGFLNSGINYTPYKDEQVRTLNLNSANKEKIKINYLLRDYYNTLLLATSKGLFKYSQRSGFERIMFRGIPHNISYKSIAQLSPSLYLINTDTIHFTWDKLNGKTSIITDQFFEKWEKSGSFKDDNGNFFKYNRGILTVQKKGETSEKVVYKTDSTIKLRLFDHYHFFPFVELNDAIYIILDKAVLKVQKKDFTCKQVYTLPDEINSISYFGVFENKLRIISYGNFYSLDIKTWKLEKEIISFIKRKEIVAAVLYLGDNKFCISTFRGIFIYDHDKKSYYRPNAINEDNLNPDILFPYENGVLIEINGGLASFQPHNFVNRPILQSPVVLTDFYLFNKGISISPNGILKKNITNSDSIELSHKESVFSFEISLLNYYNSHKNNYAYKLEGFDKDWNYIGTRKVATYTNIPPGTYTFLFKGKGESSSWSNEGKLVVIIHPAFWQTWWFYLLVFAFIVVLTYIYIKIREARLRAQKKVLEKQVMLRTKEIVEKNNEILAQNEEILSINEEIEAQREKLQEVYEEVTDNIQTAKRIQESILPKEETIKQYLPEHFILFRPKDIVSGDFYWFFTKFDKIYIAAVDCTGHGVSGAFMSLIGKCLLDQIIIEDPSATAGQILNSLSKLLVRTLQQDLEDAVSKDGMDIALCIIDKEDGTIQFSGANNPLIIKTPDQIQTIKGDPMGIGLLRGKPAEGFTNHIVTIDPTHSYYIFSDGYVSQFGGESGVDKYKISRFRDMIENLTAEDSGAQKMYFENMLDQWQGKTDQTDDILVIGFEITD